MTTGRELLDNLMRAIVAEFGYLESKSALDRASIPHTKGKDLHDISAHHNKTRIRKASAREQVQRAKPSETQLVLLLEIAEKFDRKHFLPSNADVRQLLMMMGERPTDMKDRSDAFRALLKALLKQPTQTLQKLADNAHHTGPSQLGPLSDAISAAAETLPRRGSGTS